MSIESQMQELAGKRAIDYLPKALAECSLKKRKAVNHHR